MSNVDSRLSTKRNVIKHSRTEITFGGKFSAPISIIVKRGISNFLRMNVLIFILMLSYTFFLRNTARDF